MTLENEAPKSLLVGRNKWRTGTTEPPATSVVLVALDLCSLRAVFESEDGLARGVGESEFGEGVVWRGRSGVVSCSSLEGGEGTFCLRAPRDASWRPGRGMWRRDWWVGSSVVGGSCGSADERDTRRM